MNITRRRDSYHTHFNNRNSNFGNHSAWRRTTGWPEFRRVSKNWKKRLQMPKVQDAQSQAATKSHFSAIKPFQSFIPVNFTIRIPNFSGVRSPDLFVFRNSSAKSAQFTTSSTPARVFPQSSSCSHPNKDVGAGLMKSNETEMNDDVQYLYTVQTKGGELVEVVDLSEDSEGPSSDTFKASDHLPANGVASSNVKKCGNNSIIRKCLKMLEKETAPSSEKQNAAHRKGLKRKKSSEDLHCDVCETDYEFVRSRGEEIFKARCEHMFCQQCLKKLDLYKCPKCDLYLQKLFKVFL